MTTMPPSGAHTVAVRAADVADAPMIGEVHVAAWRAGYRGLMPQDYLDGLDGSARARWWERVLRNPTEHPDQRVVVATLGNRVVGFASFGRPMDPSPPGTGELYAINAHPDAWGAGAGPAMLNRVHSGLAELGYARATLWVVPGNARARRFYERHGWRLEDVERTAEVLGVTVPEVRYLRELEPSAARPSGT